MKNAIWSDDEVGAGRSSLPDYLSQTEGNVGRVVSPPLPAPAVTTNINIITIRGTHAAAYTSLHLTGTTMFSLNMRGLCHASVDTVYRRDSVLCHCHPPDNWPECQLLFIRVHQSLYITITQSHNDIQHYFQFFSIHFFSTSNSGFRFSVSITITGWFQNIFLHGSLLESWCLMLFDVSAPSVNWKS